MSTGETHPVRGATDGKSGGFLTKFSMFGLAIGAAVFAWILIDSMNPSAEALNPTVWVDLERIAPGQRKTAIWRDSIPVFVVHRTPKQIAAVRADDGADMPFPERDRERVQRDEWLVVIGDCHQPKGQEQREFAGRWGGWYCPYRDREYDLSGRLRTKWGGRNLPVPPHYFHDDKWLVIGEAP